MKATISAHGCLLRALHCSILFLLTALMPLNFSAQAAGPEMAAAEFSVQLAQDLRLLRSFIDNLKQTVQLMEGSGLFDKSRKKDFDLREKEDFYLLWGGYLDHMLGFESLINNYRGFHLISDRQHREDAFLVAYAASLAKYAYGLRIIGSTINNDLYEKKLDDLNPEYGIPAGMYARLKWNTIHVQDLSGVLAGYQYYRFLRKSYEKRGLLHQEGTAWIFGSIERNYQYITGEMKQKGTKYFLANGLDIVKEKTFTAWFPIQMSVAEWMGDTKVRRVKKTLISPAQIELMNEHLDPGDIIVARRNWYLSNIGLPGFWPHAELYIGGYQEMAAFFSDPLVAGHYQDLGYQDFMDYLEEKYPGQMQQYRNEALDGYPFRIIEAVGEGVKLSSLQEGTSADYIGVLRPRLSRLDIARAIDEAFHYLGRPYDFNFDFLTDSSIVCSELVYKIYKQGEEKQGLQLSLRKIAGREAMPTNDLVRKFDREFDSPDRELDLVYFLDGSEKEKKAVVRSESDFRSSHRRMKWDIVQK